jgi:hypothetical protein
MYLDTAGDLLSEPSRTVSSPTYIIITGIVSKLTIKVWMCQKCGKMKDYNQKKKMITSAV